MTQVTQPIQNCFVDTNRQVFHAIHVAEGGLVGILGHPVWIAEAAISVSKSFAQRTISVTREVTPKDGFVDSSEHMAKVNANPRRKAALERARKRYGSWLQGEEIAGVGLAALRLKAGLSQAELAERMGMAQPNISRLEKEPGDPQYSTLKALAAALSVTVAEVCSAIEGLNQKSAEQVQNEC